MSQDTSEAPNNAGSIETISHAPGPTNSSISLAQPMSWWLKRFFACNPFYILSAASLLYGLYRISLEPHFFNNEIGHLIFNFTSLQTYEVLLIVTAMVLARRRIWYDSLLLAGLENLLLLVPFILVSQAALIDSRMVWIMCGTGGALALIRLGALRRLARNFNFSAPMFLIGSSILVLNVGLPILYRTLHESKVGTKPDWGAAFYTNQYVWLIVLPILCGLVNFVPGPFSNHGKSARKSFLPLAWYVLWLSATCVHLFCLGYVYDFDLRLYFIAPGLWVLCWTAYYRAAAFFPPLEAWVQRVILILPTTVTLLAASQFGNKVFLLLSILNATIYTRIYSRYHGPRLALHLLLISLAALIAGLPQEISHSVVVSFNRPEMICVAVAGYFLVCAALSRNPKIGLVGALVAAAVTAVITSDSPNSLHWILQAGFIVFLLHSLGWTDAEHPGARGVRVFVALLWLGHTGIWTQVESESWETGLTASTVMTVYLAGSLWRNRWAPHIVPIVSILVALCRPFSSLLAMIGKAPVGLLAVAASFLLLAVGTLAAFTKHRWYKPDL